jgi:putative PIN family toxin of toxin-antitoxin system
MGKKTKVVFDTNVWLSLFMKKTLSEEFSRALNREIVVYTTEAILKEISRVLTYPKITHVLGASGIKQKEILRTIVKNSTIITPKLELHIVEDDPEDNKILDCALQAGADFIVSGDKHLLALGKVKKTRILTPREFLDLIASG